MNAVNKIEQIEQDFDERNEPFDDVVFPEERLLHEASVNAGTNDEPLALSDEDTLRLVSLFSTFDYNRNANQLVDNILELQEREPKVFDAWKVDALALDTIFSDIGFRYPNRDAHAWQKNCRILREQYHGRWHELLLDTGLDAVTLVEQVRDDDFNCLTGVKIAPMYARIISQEVAELDRLWDLDIAVDTHIRQLSKKLFEDADEDLSDDEIRDRWYFYAVQNDVSRHVVDAALWQIGNNWEQWGESYFNEL
jgi:endonuclease III